MTGHTQLALDRNQYLELEKIGLGAFAPLDGFMDETTFRSVVESMRLPSGAVFPLPVVLDVSEADAKRLQAGTSADLTYDGNVVGEIEPCDFYGCDRPFSITRNRFLWAAGCVCSSARTSIFRPTS
jgi:sulfate adenylyltransferase